jgi:hypothetical protein
VNEGDWACIKMDRGIGMDRDIEMDRGIGMEQNID